MGRVAEWRVWSELCIRSCSARLDAPHLSIWLLPTVSLHPILPAALPRWAR